MQGVFKGTPTKCSICHSPGSRIATTSKPTDHVPTAMACESCHTSAITWTGARFTHMDVKPGACKSCHGVTAKGKSNDHFPTNDSCDVCHRTTTFVGAQFHANVQAAPGSCATCHGGSFPKLSPSKPGNHPAITAACDTCHMSVTTWMTGGFNHANVRADTCSSCHGVTAKGKSADHIPTTASCDTCHTISGRFLDGHYHRNVQAAPGSCSTCHGGSYPKHTPVKTSTHPVTGAACDTCHTSFTSWVMAGGFNHANVQAGTCSSCHGTTAKGKSNDHIPTTASCDTCHTITGAFLDGHYHRNVQATPGSCNICHGGGYPKHTPAKPSGHTANTVCDSCHTSYLTWALSTFNHANVQAGTCSSCHGISAKGKPSTHIPTTASCDLCHRISGAFLDGKYHANVQATPGNCASCHGIIPNVKAKPSGHFVTTRPSCNACHVVASFVTPIRYTHSTPYYRAHTASAQCVDCHRQKNEVIVWPYSYKPDCAGCHAGNLWATGYKQDAHKKTQSPTTIFYTVSELKDCAGSCHEYTNNTFTTIKTNRTGHHRPTDGGF